MKLAESPALLFDVAAREWIGQRKEQQDSFCYVTPAPDNVVALVADGMGGTQGGKDASQILARALFGRVHTSRIDVANGSAEKILLESLTAGQQEVAQYAQHHNLQGMGTTFAALAIANNHLAWVSVGDSLILRWRNRTLTRLNADHSYGPILAELVRRGAMSEAEALQDPKRTALRSVVGVLPPRLVEAVTRPHEVEPDDCYVLASDGLLSLTLEEVNEIVSLHRGKAASRTTEALLQAIQHKQDPRQDNTTLIVINATIARPGFTARLSRLLGLRTAHARHYD